VSTAATRFQSMQRTDIGVEGSTPFDMARTFRSVRRVPRLSVAVNQLVRPIEVPT
jgi:hypothetical protein